MNQDKRTIFRTEAVEQYLQGRGMDLLPYAISPRIFAYLWITLSCLMAGGFALWLIWEMNK